MRKIILPILLGATLAACQQNPNPSSQNNLNQIKVDTIDPKLEKGNENDFATKAAIGSMMEVESSALMIKRTENPSVQNLATIMVKDHLMAQKELKQIALKEKLTIPQKLPADKMAKLAKLDSLKEDERNHYYAELMVMEHNEAVNLFKNASTNETNAALAKFATAKVATLEHHLMEAKKVLRIMNSIRGDKGDQALKTSKESSAAQ